MRLKVFAQFAKQGGVFRKPFHEDLPRAVERTFGIGKAERGSLGLEIFFRFVFRGARRIGEQRFGQRRQPGLARNLRLGAALGLIRQVKVFECLLGFGGVDLRSQLRRQCALFVDGGEDRCTAFFQFAQVGQPFSQRAQLCIVKPAGCFLAVAGDERHGGAFVKQGYSGFYLLVAAADRFCDAVENAGGCGGRLRMFRSVDGRHRSCFREREKWRTLRNRMGKFKLASAI